MEDIIDIIVTETTNLIEITSQPTDEIIDVNIIDNREDVTLNVTPTLVEININSLTGNFGVNWGEIAGTLSNQNDLQNALNLKADLVDGKVPSSQLPSYVDDVVEVANYAALPVTGEVGKIYITLDTNYIYRWTGSTYVEIKDSSAVWGAITGTLSNQTDLQNALNLKANDSLVVHLAGTETITGAKTFSSAVIAPNFVLSGGTGNTGLYYGHTDRVVLANYTTGGIDFEVNGGSIVATLFPSGNYGLGITLDAGYKLDVNGTTRISGALSGTSASFSSSVTASSLIKSGGTSSQFLKADGSVDSTSYQTLLTNPVTGTGTSGIVAVFNGTSSITDSSIYANSTRVSIGADVTTTNRFTAVSSTTSAYAIAAQASSAAHGIWSNVLGTGEIFRGQTAGGSYFIINNGGNAFLNGNLNVGDFASTSYRLNVVGTANFTGALSGTSATFTTTSTVPLTVATTAGNSGIIIKTSSSTYNWLLGAQYTLGNGFEITPSTAVGGTTFTNPVFSILSSGAATFSSTIAATSATLSGDLTLTSTGGHTINMVATTAGSQTISMTALGGGSNTITGTGGDLNIQTTGAYPIVFKTNSTENLRIASGGAATFSSSVTAGTFLRASSGAQSNPTGGASVAIDYQTTSDIQGRIRSRDWDGATWKNLTLEANNIILSPTGNVGIGTTSPSQLLHINVASGAVYNRIQNNNNSLYLGLESGGIAQVSSDSSSLKVMGATYTSFETAGSERMRITSGGNVLIGTTTDSGYKLLVNGTSKFNDVLIGASFESILGSYYYTNLYYSSGFRVRANGYGSFMGLDNSNGDILFATTGSGTAGNTVSYSYRFTIKNNGVLNYANCPSSATGLASGDIYKDGSGFLKIV